MASRSNPRSSTFLELGWGEYDRRRAPAGFVGGSPIPPGLAINDLNVCSAAGQLNSTTACSADRFPDVIEKMAFDPGCGHYEIFGLQRWFTDRVFTTAIPSGAGTNKTTFGWGVGGSVLLPVIPKYLELQGSVMTGQGIGQAYARRSVRIYQTRYIRRLSLPEYRRKARTRSSRS